MNRLKQQYLDEIKTKIANELGIENVNAIPKLQKICLNIGIGNAHTDKKIVTTAVEHLSRIAGQKAIVTKSKKSIAGFKIRDGWPMGVRVTLRGERMYAFLDRCVSIVLPRVRDFRGISAKGFDKKGNFNFSFKELVFPEIDLDDLDPNVSGLNVTIGTSSKSDLGAYTLLKAFGFPFRGVVKGANQESGAE